MLTLPPGAHSHYWLGRPLLLAPHTLPACLAGTQRYAAPGRETQANIAVLPIHGPLTQRRTVWGEMFGLASYEGIGAMLEEAVADNSIHGILLDIDSPGGDAAGMLDLADRIVALRAQKPIWALAADSAFSAAYALASAAERVLVTRTGGVGSIGVIAAHVDQSGFDAQAGIRITTISAGARKNDFSPHQPLSGEAAGILQAEVDRLYGLFTATVARNRGMDEQAVRATEAGLFFGENAVTAGLVDAVVQAGEAVPLLRKAISARRALILPPSKKEKTMEQPVPATATETPPDAAKIAADAAVKATDALKAQHLEIIHSCRLAGCPEQAASFFEQGLSPSAVKEKLFEWQAKKAATEIQSAVFPGTGTQAASESPLVIIAKQRAAAASTPSKQ